MARHHREKYFFGANSRAGLRKKNQGREQLIVDDT
jgi:hypothetical protein